MAGVLANSNFGRTEHTESPVHGKDRVAKGALFLAIDPERFPGGDLFGGAWTRSCATSGPPSRPRDSNRCRFRGH